MRGKKVRADSLNAIKILVNLLIVIDPTYHRHKKIPSMSFSGIQGIVENFNGIEGINSKREAGKILCVGPCKHEDL